MGTKKEEFLASFIKDVQERIPGMDIEVVEKMANQLWTGRDINYSVVDNEEFNVLAHRYFHGVGYVRMQLLLSSIPEELMFMMPLLLSEYMFAYGFMCGIADERGWDVDTVSPRAEAAECLADRNPIIMTREELDREDALPSPVEDAEGVLPEDFKPTPPPTTPPEDMGKGGYH